MRPIWDLDVQAFKLINLGLHRDWLDPVFLVITKTGDWPQALALVLALIYKPTRRVAWVAAVAYMLAGIVRLAIEAMVHRQRPSNFSFAHPVENVFGDTSFPSGHTTTSFAVAFAVWLCLRKGDWAWSGRAFMLWACLVGISRIYLGVHFPTDVLAGAILGCLGGYAAYARLGSDETAVDSPEAAPEA